MSLVRANSNLAISQRVLSIQSKTYREPTQFSNDLHYEL